MVGSQHGDENQCGQIADLHGQSPRGWHLGLLIKSKDLQSQRRPAKTTGLDHSQHMPIRTHGLASYCGRPPSTVWNKLPPKASPGVIVLPWPARPALNSPAKARCLPAQPTFRIAHHFSAVYSISKTLPISVRPPSSGVALINWVIFRRPCCLRPQEDASGRSGKMPSSASSPGWSGDAGAEQVLRVPRTQQPMQGRG